MYFIHSRNPWGLSEHFNPSIDFCIWVLQVDGLHVPPFDQHPDGDGSLRMAGLTAESWQSWLRYRLTPLQGMGRTVEDWKAWQRRILDLERQGNEREHIEHRLASWGGSQAVRDRLLELYLHYEQSQREKVMWLCDVHRAIQKFERHAEESLYHMLRPYHNRIPSLTIYEVFYDYPLDCIMLPATLFMTVQEGQPEPLEYRERVQAAVAELAALSVRKRGPAQYIRETDRRFIAAYARSMRKPVLPASPRPAMPRLEDVGRQAVLEHWVNERFSHYGIIDFATVQFLREKNRPGWRLYEVMFREVDGEQHREIIILHQGEDGVWHYHSSTSWGGVEHRGSETVAPIHDHPLIFLPFRARGYSGSQSLDHAYGHVVDNGFHVEQVRLVNDAGQILEDTVEDGWVFFACEWEQEFRLPAQVELYNGEGQLVWRQTTSFLGGWPPWLEQKIRGRTGGGKPL